MAGERPTGISILAGLAAIGSAIGVFVLLSAANNDVGPLPYLVSVVYVIAAGATAHGLWGLRWWAWPVALAMWTGTGVQAVLTLGRSTLSTDLVVAPVAVVYLLRPDIRALFGVRVAAPSRVFVAATVLLAAAVAFAPIAGQLSAQWVPTVPPAAPTTLVAQIAVPAAGSDAASGDPVGLVNECLKRDARPAGWADLCWSVVRQPDEDPAGDYYRLEVRGTFGADAQDPGTSGGSGVRWIVVRSVLSGAVADGVTDIQPDGTIEGCPGAAGVWPLGIGQATLELPCDGTTVGSASGLGTEPGHPHTATVAWTCRGCLFTASRHERAIGLADTVKVAEGAQPGWQLYADFGG